MSLDVTNVIPLMRSRGRQTSKGSVCACASDQDAGSVRGEKTFGGWEMRGDWKGGTWVGGQAQEKDIKRMPQFDAARDSNSRALRCPRAHPPPRKPGEALWMKVEFDMNDASVRMRGCRIKRRGRVCKKERTRARECVCVRARGRERARERARERERESEK